MPKIFPRELLLPQLNYSSHGGYMLWLIGKYLLFSSLPSPWLEEVSLSNISQLQSCKGWWTSVRSCNCRENPRRTHVCIIIQGQGKLKLKHFVEIEFSWYRSPLSFGYAPKYLATFLSQSALWHICKWTPKLISAVVHVLALAGYLPTHLSHLTFVTKLQSKFQ